MRTTSDVDEVGAGVQLEPDTDTEPPSAIVEHINTARANATIAVEAFDEAQRTISGIGHEIDAYESELATLERFGLRVQDARVRLHAQRQRVAINVEASSAQRDTTLSLMLRDITDRMNTALERCIPVDEARVKRVEKHRIALRDVHAPSVATLAEIAHALDIAHAVLEDVRADVDRVQVCVAEAKLKKSRHLDVGALAETLSEQQRHMFASYEASCADLAQCVEKYCERSKAQATELLADVAGGDH